jgi:hypothetical protein
MQILRFVPLCVVAFAAACSQEPGSGQGARGSTDPVVGSTTAPTRAGETAMGTVPVIVLGSAFGLDRGTLERTIANNMQGAGWGDAQFVPASQVNQGSAYAKNYTVVMLLNAPKNTNVAAYCAGNPTPPAMSDSTQYSTRDVELAGALCLNGRDLRRVQTGADDVSGPDDPAFRKMVQRATTELTLPSGEADFFHGSDQDR